MVFEGGNFTCILSIQMGVTMLRNATNSSKSILYLAYFNAREALNHYTDLR
jgi:hypothetical protein